MYLSDLRPSNPRAQPFCVQPERWALSIYGKTLNDMNICGLKLTHDAAVAVVNGLTGQLLFCHELEKIDNAPRYTAMTSQASIGHVLASEGMTPDEIDVWAIDGWKGGMIGAPHHLTVASYHEHDGYIGGRRIGVPGVPGVLTKGYASHSHNATHVWGAYCTSPAAARGEDAAVLVWDGGQSPRLYQVSAKQRRAKFVGALHDLYGIIYSIMRYYFGPFKDEAVIAEIKLALHTGPTLPVRFGGYDAPGKLMSYIAYSKPDHALISELNAIYIEEGGRFSKEVTLGYHQTGSLEHRIMQRVLSWVPPGMSDSTVLASIHAWLEVMLVGRLIVMQPPGAGPLCFTGGSALNIKWNSALRRAGYDVWVPPFPNDCGNALGAACAEMVTLGGPLALKWDVYSGPSLLPSGKIDGWDISGCNPEKLGALLAADDTAVVAVLNGRAELGPRALGNRSLLAAATNPEMKSRLNTIKHREGWRPVAPICLESAAARIFDPGTPDPYMLFDHKVRAGWESRIPAVMHLDGTARLQTLTPEQNPVIARVLASYAEHSAFGQPLLCNTSANLNGCGFFPDAASACRWGVVSRVWAEGVLYDRRQPPSRG